MKFCLSKYQIDSHELGDKIKLPPQVLEAITENNKEILSPLIFKVSIKENSIYCGVSEFSANEDTIILNERQYKLLNTTDESPLFFIEDVDVPKGNWAQVTPLHRDYIEIKNLKY